MVSVLYLYSICTLSVLYLYLNNTVSIFKYQTKNMDNPVLTKLQFPSYPLVRYRYGKAWPMSEPF